MDRQVIDAIGPGPFRSRAVMEDSWHPSTSITYLAKRIWVNGFLAGLGVVLVIVMGWVLVWGVYPRTASQNAAIDTLPPLTQAIQNTQPGIVPPPMGAQTPFLDTSVDLKAQLEAVLGRIKEANQKKDLDGLLAVYSTTFPELPKRARIIAHSWQTCNFPEMGFLIEEIKPLPDGRVFARVNWDIRVEDSHTKNLKKVTRAYLVWFVNESGEWRIQTLKKVE
jgi:hypothetical protein